MLFTERDNWRPGRISGHMIWLHAAIIVSSLINTNFCPAQRVIDTFFTLKKSGKDFRKVCKSTYCTGFTISLLYHLANS